MPTVNLIKGDNVDGADYRDALPENMIAVARDILGVNGYFISHPGLTKYADGIGNDRGGVWNERFNKHFRVSGVKLIEVSKDGVVTEIGTITGADRVSWATSFNTQAIVADGKMWLYDNEKLTQVTDSDLGKPIDITWVDGYYFLTDGEYIYHTSIDDETAIDPLKFASAEFSPDDTLAVTKTADNQVLVFGRYSVEYFSNVATDNFAFQRSSAKAQKLGIEGTRCHTELDGNVFVLGGRKTESPSIHLVQAGISQSIATREVDKILASYTESELKNAWLESRTYNRDQFLIVQLPDHTLCCNYSAAKKTGVINAWFIIKTSGLKWCGAGGVFDPRNSKWIYGDCSDPRIGYLDQESAAQYGELSESILYTPLIKADGNSINHIEIDTLPGHNLDTDKVTTSISLTYDGITYGKEWFKLYGVTNDYSTRFIIRRLGYVRDYVGLKIRTISKEIVNFAGLNYG